MHKVKRKETVFSVSREYGISEQRTACRQSRTEKRNEKGQYLCIPYPGAITMQPTTPKEDPYAIPPSNSELFRKSKETPKNISTIQSRSVTAFPGRQTYGRIL